MIEKLTKTQAAVKYAQIIKIQNNIQNNSGITSAVSKNNCQIDTGQTDDVKKFLSVDKRKGNLSSRFWIE